MLRTSSYTIYADLPGENEEMLIAHGYTAACDKVSRSVAAYLGANEVRRPPKPLYGSWSPPPTVDGEIPEPSEQTVDVLRRRGYLTHLSPAAEEELFVRISNSIHVHKLRLPPSFVIMPTYDCNLRCPYCFQDGLRNGPGAGSRLQILDKARLHRIFQGMEEIEQRRDLPADSDAPRRITLFGGEPLLEAAGPVIRELLAETGKTDRSVVTAVTNGTQLHHFRDCLGPRKISGLQITLDGPPAEHDVRRVDVRGRGSFERIARNITLALELEVRVEARINVDRNNAHTLPALAEEIESRGWTESSRFVAYVAPIRSEDEGSANERTLSSWDLHRLVAELRAQEPSMRHIRTSGDLVRDRIRRILAGREMLSSHLKSSFCGAHSSMYIFDAFGDIYACWERTGDPTIRIGRTTEGGGVDLDTDLARRWHGRTVATNAACRKCRFALYCGGGCAALAVNKRNKFFSNYCDGFASSFRASLAESYIEHRAGSPVSPAEPLTCDL